uniref:Ig-like domain-containing protein n=1 Tax=Hucho hucho TaxID=62062 RepID=A0A4W5PLY6_9TELE
MLDDVQVGYYDSNDKQSVYRGQHITDKAEDDEAQDGVYVFGNMYHHMKERSFQLKHHFNLTEGREKNVVMRKVPPRLRLIKKEVSGGFQVSCLAFGFYPRHINLTLLRDGHGDGTYQLRKSLEVSTEELKQRHHYTCTASHLSLDNKLDVSLESGAERVHLSTLSALLYVYPYCTIIPLLQTIKCSLID